MICIHRVGIRLLYILSIQLSIYIDFQTLQNNILYQNYQVNFSNFFYLNFYMTEENPLIQKDDTIYFKLIDKVGSHGRYQYLIATIIIIQWFVMGAVELGLSLLFLDSSPNCDNIILDKLTCYQYVCTLPQSEWGFYYPNRVDSLRFAFNNLFICNKAWIISLMQSMVFIGCFFSNLIYSYLPDNFGRKFAYLISWGTTCIGIIILCVSWNIVVAGIGLFLIGLGIDQTQSSTFMILYEQVKYKPRQYYCVLVQMSFCLGGMSISGIFFVLQRWRSLAIYTFAIPAIFAFLAIYFLEENPKYTMKTKGVEITLLSLGRIANMNGIKENPITKQDILKAMKQQKKENNITLKDALKYRSVRIPTIFSAFIFCCLTVLYFGPVFIIQQIGFNPLVNQAIISFSQLITYPVAFLIITIVRRKMSGIFSFIICGFTTGLLLFLKEPDNCNLCSFQYIQLGLVCFSRFFLTIYFTIFMLYSTELIPQSARGVSFGVIGLISRIFGFLNPFLIQFFDDRNWNIMILFTVFAFIAVIMILPLKQTLNQPMMEQIPQLQDLKQKLINETILNEKNNTEQDFSVN